MGEMLLLKGLVSLGDVKKCGIRDGLVPFQVFGCIYETTTAIPYSAGDQAVRTHSVTDSFTHE